MIVEIKVQFRADETHAQQTVELDGVQFRFDTYTNRNDGMWYLDIRDALGEPVLLGLALVVGVDLLAQYRHLDVPAGALFVHDYAGPREDPGLTSFIDREAALYYQTADQALTSLDDF